MEPRKKRQRPCEQQSEHFDVSTFWSRVLGYRLEDPVFASRQRRKIFYFSENLLIVSGANPATSSMGTQSLVYTGILYACHTSSPSHLPRFGHLSNNLYFLRRGRHTVAQLVEAQRYKSEGRGFDSRWCHWNFSLT